ncbi:hypothetical protein TREAZ_1597 [Leadbettera azotonutricia ZAS-9]|uniref:Uncharacterized protein n=1 Tax=Leadbettera azotonutricia (strain ATCC BAA-888 / DSM 13862 / ZAS-9) TaxID=545695 RepID=F5YDF6_LEAAZ|nr:hypothetical protein TREAZ_1597 [Leadbettera azotonutricia ZAS-9]
MICLLLYWNDEAQVWVAVNGKPHEGIPLHFKADRVVVAA